MATKNPRVVAYVQPENHAKLREYMEANGLTESKAIDVILGEFFGVDVPRVASSSIPGDLTEQITDIKDRLGRIERVLGKTA
jgi:hypothetical protein